MGGTNKKEVEHICGICWPCKEDTAGCEKNWGAPCPHGYSLKDFPLQDYAAVAGETCARDFDQDGMCELEIEFEDVAAKRAFAERCGVEWPCKSHCEDNVVSE